MNNVTTLYTYSKIVQYSVQYYNIVYYIINGILGRFGIVTMQVIVYVRNPISLGIVRICSNLYTDNVI